MNCTFIWLLFSDNNLNPNMIEFSDITSNVCKAEFVQNSQAVAIASGTKLLLRESNV